MCHKGCDSWPSSGFPDSFYLAKKKITHVQGMGCSRGEGVAQLQRFALDVHNPQQLKEGSEEPGTPAQPAAGAGKGSSTFSLRWIRVKGMVCLSWGLLFLVSCWMGSAMSATEPHSSHLRLRAAETALKCASFLWGLWDWFCLLSAREGQSFF